ncbi:MAG: hypothetical protein AAFR61_12355 [Bacteroidota bacterium]
MTRIGLLVQEFAFDYHQYHLIKEILSWEEVEIFFLHTPTASNARFSHQLDQVTPGGLNPKVFGLQLKLEDIMVKKAFHGGEKLAAFSLEKPQNSQTISLAVSHDQAGRLLIGEEELEKIRDLELDLMVRLNTAGNIGGKLPEAAKYGIISLHFGEPGAEVQGPPGFWELNRRSPSTPFSIQLHHQVGEQRTILLRGEVPNKYIYLQNKIALQDESYLYFTHFIRKIVIGEPLESQGEATISTQQLKVPNLFQIIGYQLKTAGFLGKLALDRAVLKKSPIWIVGFAHKPYEQFEPAKSIVIPNPSKRFLADPFVIKKEGRNILFVEDYYWDKLKGVITAIELKGDQYEILGTVIEEDFHMSYPFMFHYNDELYMVPECHQTQSVRLYKCVDFPMKWEFQKVLMPNLNTVDTNIFQHNGYWWLLTNANPSSDSYDYSSQLHVFYTPDDPINGEWIPHPQNPVVYANRGRNGGFYRTEEGEIFRMSQKYGFNFYGKSIHISKIIDLDPERYSEESVGEIQPDFFKKIQGTHHLNANDEYTVFDFVKVDKIK